MKPKKLISVLSAIILIAISTVAFGQNMNFRLYRGQILNPASNKSVPDVVVYSSKTQASVLSDLEGKFAIITPLGSILNTDTIIPGFIPIIVTENNSSAFHSNINYGNSENSSSPYFEVVSESEKAWMPLNSTIVDVNIAGIIASVSVKQIYVNSGEDILEAVYVFPGSTRAAVFSMKMTIGKRVINAVIKEKEEARQEYEDAKSSGKTASLLEQNRPNVFQMNVANILPGDTIIVEMSYVEEIYSEHGVYSFVFPTIVGPRYSTSNEKWIQQAKIQNSEKPMSELIINTKIFAPTPIKFVKSSSHSIDVNYPSPFEAEVKINSNDKKLDVISPETISENYWIGRDYIIRYGLRGKTPASGILTYEHNDENFFLLNIQAPEKITKSELPKCEYIFIIDVSGSMNGFPISISKKLMLNLLNNLNPDDKFNVLLFSGGNNLLSKESIPASKENIENAMRIIDK